VATRGGASKREPARPSVLLTAQHQALHPSPRLPEVAVKPSSKSRANKVDRTLRCGACDGCKRADCGRCPNCKDKPKFGGAGVKKQACQYRGCLTPTRTGNGRVLPPDPERASSQISSADESSEPVNGYVSPRLSESSARGSFEEGAGLPAALLGAAGLVERSINEEGELEARPLEARKPLGASALLHAEKPLAKVCSPGKRSRR